MKFLRGSQVCFYLFFVCFVDAYATEQTIPARDLLMRMTKAMSSLNYHGTIALFRNGKLETLKFSHSVNEGSEQERLVSLNSPLREIIRNSKQVKCIFLDSKQVVVDHRPSRRSFLMDLPENLKMAEKLYILKLEANETIAMQPTQVVSIKPLDKYRFARKIWVAEKSHLPLKFELTDDKGTILEQMVFTDIAVLESIPKIDIQVDTTPNVRHIHQMQTLDFKLSSFALNQVPPGFEKMFFTHQSISEKGQPVEHLLLSDGFSSISVYLEKTSQQLEVGHQSAGAVNSYFRQLVGHQLTIMGEVPTRTLQFIADGFHFKNAELSSSAIH